jgi:hypothetical protein
MTGDVMFCKKVGGVFIDDKGATWWMQLPHVGKGYAVKSDDGRCGVMTKMGNGKYMLGVAAPGHVVRSNGFICCDYTPVDGWWEPI